MQMNLLLVRHIFLFVITFNVAIVSAQECFCAPRPGEYKCRLSAVVVVCDDDTIFTLNNVLELDVYHYEHYDPITMHNLQTEGAYIGELEIRYSNETLWLESQPIRSHHDCYGGETKWKIDSLYNHKKRYHTDGTNVELNILNSDSLKLLLRNDYRVFMLPVTLEYPWREKWNILQAAISKTAYEEALELADEFLTCFQDHYKQEYNFFQFLKTWIIHKQLIRDYKRYQQFYAQFPVKKLAQRTVGNQIWSKNTLSVSTFTNGDRIPFATDYSHFDSLTKKGIAAYWIDQSGYYEYNNSAILDARGIAPIGWHIASLEDWSCLVTDPNLSARAFTKWIPYWKKGRNCSYSFPVYSQMCYYPFYSEKCADYSEDFGSDFLPLYVEMSTDGTYKGCYIRKEWSIEADGYSLFVVKNPE